MSQLPKKHPLRSVPFCFDEIEDAKSLKASDPVLLETNHKSRVLTT